MLSKKEEDCWNTYLVRADISLVEHDRSSHVRHTKRRKNENTVMINFFMHAIKLGGLYVFIHCATHSGHCICSLKPYYSKKEDDDDKRRKNVIVHHFKIHIS